MGRSRFHRQHSSRSYRRLFVISTEGAKDEPSYFRRANQHLQKQHRVVVKCLYKADKSAPPYVLQRMQAYLKNEELRPGDEAWIVVDRDDWPEAQLNNLFTWTTENDQYHLALSNPKFEYWLLLHFEDGKGVPTAPECDERLKKHFPRCKQVSDIISRITLAQVQDAIRRAKEKDDPPCLGWPHELGQTTVYKLVENLIQGS